MQQVVKRDGKIVDFNSEKITNAIQKAASTTNEFSAQTARQLTRQVIDITRKMVEKKQGNFRAPLMKIPI